MSEFDAPPTAEEIAFAVEYGPCICQPGERCKRMEPDGCKYCFWTKGGRFPCPASITEPEGNRSSGDPAWDLVVQADEVWEQHAAELDAGWQHGTVSWGTEVSSERWSAEEARIIKAQLTGRLPMFLTSRGAVEAWRALNEVVRG